MNDTLHSSYSHPVLRDYQELKTSISVKNLMYPVFVIANDNAEQEISSMPGVSRLGINKLIEVLNPLIKRGLSSILLFGVIDSSLKDSKGSAADGPNNPVIPAIKLLKQKFPDILIACDVCLCGYTDHGHCGILDSTGNIDNSASIKRIAEVAVAYAIAGCHVVAPSDMMDGRVLAIKKLLQFCSLDRVSILSYSVKFASKFYGPFRDAASSAPSFGDRRNYQLPPGSRGLAARAAARDVEEGADMLMVKPGIAYLDIVRDVKEKHPDYVLFIYQVSGEYAMLYHAAEAGVFDLKDAVLESLHSMRRADAEYVLRNAYHSLWNTKWLTMPNLLNSGLPSDSQWITITNFQSRSLIHKNDIASQQMKINKVTTIRKCVNNYKYAHPIVDNIHQYTPTH